MVRDGVKKREKKISEGFQGEISNGKYRVETLLPYTKKWY